MRFPEVEAIRTFPWQFFATFTFDSRNKPIGKVPGEPVQVKMFFTAVRRFAAASGIHFRSLLWVMRREIGEIGQREHLRALFAGVPNYFVNGRSCLALMSIWEDQRNGGIARVRTCVGQSETVDYVVEELDLSGADRYELNKFGKAGNVMLSRSLLFRFQIGYRNDKKTGVVLRSGLKERRTLTVGKRAQECTQKV